MIRPVQLIVLFALISASLANPLLNGFNSLLSPDMKKNAEKLSGNANEAIKDANSATGMDIPVPEEQTGLMRLFFTATPSPSVTPTPSSSPSPSITASSSPSPSTTASVTPTPSTSGAVTVTPTPSKSPSPTPFRPGFDNRKKVPDVDPVVSFAPPIIVEREVVLTDNVEQEVEVDLTDEEVEEDDIVEIDEVELQGDINPNLFDGGDTSGGDNGSDGDTGDSGDDSNNNDDDNDDDNTATPSPAAAEAANSVSRFIIPGLVRQSGAAEACGYTIKWRNGEVTRIRIGDIPQQGCVQQKIKFDTVQIGFDSEGNRVKAKWTMSVKCASPGCETKTLLKVQIRKKITITPGASQTPSQTPLPSNN